MNGWRNEWVELSQFITSSFITTKGSGDLFYPGSPGIARGCWGPIPPWVPRNSKGVQGTYSTLGPQEYQGGAGNLFYPGPQG